MTQNKTGPLLFMIPGDLHLTERDLPNHRTARWIIEQANNVVFPDFVQFIGDNVQDSTDEQFELFQQLTGQLQCPWFALVGDHDVHNDPQASKFRERVGKTWGSFRTRGYRFLRLNTQESKPVGLSTEQLEWLGRELAAAEAAEERVILFQHNYPYQIWEEFAGRGIDEWRVLVQTSRIEAIFAGHTHYFQIANDGRNVHVATRSVGDPEGGAAGYLLVAIQGSDVGIHYRTEEDSGPMVVILHPRQLLLCTGSSHVVSGQSEVSARIIGKEQVVEVTAQIDQQLPLPMRSNNSEDTWRTSFDSTPLAKGIHQLTVYARDEFDRSGRQVIEFAVDQTGRFTPIPGVSPNVLATNFC